MRALVLLLALAAALPVAGAIPDVRHVSVALRESGCPASQFCLALDPPAPEFTYGERVEFVIVSAAANRRDHNFQIASFGLKSDVVPPGGEALLVATLRQGGRFAVYSGVSDDRARGMESEIVVVDPTVDETRVKLPVPFAPTAAALALAWAVAFAKRRPQA